MDDRVARLESAVAVLTERVRDLELQLMNLDRGADGVPAATATSVDPLVEGLERAPVQQWLTLAGRIFLVLGGAYLLRALTESHVVPTHIGVALGLLYGAPWLVLAARAGRRSAQLDAFCHALATALIGYPLVWEATMRFQVLGSGQSAALLGMLTAAALVLAALTRLQGLAWVVTAGALASAVTLAAATRDWNSYTLLAIALGVGTSWLGYVRNWTVCWLAAAGLDFMLLIATGRATVRGTVLGVLALQFLTFAAYVGSFAARSVVHSHRLNTFEYAQTLATLLLALGGAIVVLQSNGSALPIGVAALVLGALGYVVAFGFVRAHRDVTTFAFWSLFALVLVVVGATVTVGGHAASVVYAVCAVGLAFAGRRGGSLTVNVHAPVYALGATIASGLLGAATLALVRLPAAGWKAPDGGGLFALLALAAIVLRPAYAAHGEPRATTTDWAQRISRLVLVCTLLWTSMGIAVLIAASFLGDPRRIDPSLLATLRTGILVGATLVLARVMRYDSGREAGWLMYPLLVITGLKLVFFDLPLGRPQTLFAALAFYGFALIVAPRLSRGAVERRRVSDAVSEPEAVSVGASHRI